MFHRKNKRTKKAIIFIAEFTTVDHLEEGLNEVCHTDISGAQTPAVVCGESDLDLVVHIEPLRVMVHLVRTQSNSAHKSKRFVEIFEDKLLVYRVPVLHHDPTWSKETEC